jgi:ABC-type branched-subunit amino acid transport system ATPase component
LDALLAERITAGYGKVPVIEDVSLRVAPGSVAAVVGPNGAGKSTLLRAIFGLLRQVSGRVVVGGRDVSGWRPYQIARHGMAYVPQVDNIFPSLSVVENLEMGAFTRRTGTQERIAEVLALFPDLAAARRRRAGELSGGQRNILGMARALMLEPAVVLLDEPTAGLSPAYTTVVWEQVRRIAGTGAAVVVVEQNVDLALRHADWGYVLVAGRNRLEGPCGVLAKENLPAIFLGVGEPQAADAHAQGP